MPGQPILSEFSVTGIASRACSGAGDCPRPLRNHLSRSPEKLSQRGNPIYPIYPMQHLWLPIRQCRLTVCPRPGAARARNRRIPDWLVAVHSGARAAKLAKHRGRGRVPGCRNALCTLCDHFCVRYRPVCGAGECAKWTRDVLVTTHNLV